MVTGRENKGDARATRRTRMGRSVASSQKINEARHPDTIAKTTPTWT